MRVSIPSPLRSYTDGQVEVEADGETLIDVLADLDRAWPGIRFRMIDEQSCVRPHIRFFADRERVYDLASDISGAEHLQILCALSGG